ncbi:VWA domain-containing protein [Bradyrhizobium sp. DN5]|uniref:VWA domain-containing protein n=1 Tax=Bradyrhizobium sp. DN5 TaxID=3056950 RepID=UPI00352478AB
MLFFNRSSTAPASSNRAPVAQRRTPQPAIRCADLVALVVFNDHGKVLNGFISAFDGSFAKAVQALPNAVCGSWTNIADGLSVANDLLGRMPRGLRRRIWLLSDGCANPHNNAIWDEVARARAQWTNINTIGFGNPHEFDRDLLARIADATHNGHYYEATTVAALGQAFRRAASSRKGTNHRGEATVFCIDTSGSMTAAMEGQRRIEAVRDALNSLLVYKQKMWS